MEQCGNCGRAIGNFEQAHFFKESIICDECNARLRKPTMEYASGVAPIPAASPVAVEPAQYVETLRSPRSAIHIVCLVLFWGWNLLMLFFVCGGVFNVASGPRPQTEAEETGRAVGTMIGIGILLFFWVGGAVITGLFAMLTRPKR
ncbi:MAG TPA: hypothetical protein VF624_15740 [Tepidisphaeraceae bacterium]|jgi:hypothetical protein